MLAMFKIGDFSRFSRVSVKMLRHYDRLGLLRPACIDPLTSYRYYAADQLPHLNRILALRDLGFSLEQIAVLLDDSVPIEHIHGMLKRRQAELEQQVRADQRRLERVAARLRQIERDSHLPIAEVVVRRVAPQLMALQRQVIAHSDDCSLLFEEVETHVARHGAWAAEPPLLISHDGADRERELDVEVAIPLQKTIPGTPRIEVRE